MHSRLRVTKEKNYYTSHQCVQVKAFQFETRCDEQLKTLIARKPNMHLSRKAVVLFPVSECRVKLGIPVSPLELVGALVRVSVRVRIRASVILELG